MKNTCLRIQGAAIDYMPLLIAISEHYNPKNLNNNFVYNMCIFSYIFLNKKRSTAKSTNSSKQKIYSTKTSGSIRKTFAS